MINDPTKNLRYVVIVEPLLGGCKYTFPATSLDDLKKIYDEKLQELHDRGIDAELEAVQIMPDGSHSIVDYMMARTDAPARNPRGRPVGSIKTDNKRLPHTITLTNLAWEIAKERGNGNASAYIEEILHVVEAW